MAKRRGFTLIEVLVAGVLGAVGIAACVATIGQMQKAQAVTIEHERMLRMSILKFDELSGLGDFNELEGDYSDQGLSYTWAAALDPTGVEGVERLSVTVTLERNNSTLEETSYGLVYRPADTSTTTAAGVGP